ncbi:MAG: RNA polymerase sigma factor [Acidimicrobiia bacterium]
MSESRVAAMDSDEASYTAFVREVQERVQHALVAGFGVEVGREAAEEALVYAWEHWDRISSMANRAGYVFRVGHRLAQKMVRKEKRAVALPDPQLVTNPVDVEPGLADALACLSARQRMVVVLVDGFGFSQRETAALLGIRRTSVQKHLERGMSRLRSEMGVAKHE